MRIFVSLFGALALLAACNQAQISSACAAAQGKFELAEEAVLVYQATAPDRPIPEQAMTAYTTAKALRDVMCPAPVVVAPVVVAPVPA